MNSLSKSGTPISASNLSVFDLWAWTANKSCLGKFSEEDPPAHGQMLLLWNCLDDGDGWWLRGLVCSELVLEEMEIFLGLDDWAACITFDKGRAAIGTIDEAADGSFLMRSRDFSLFARPGSAFCLFSLSCSAFRVNLCFFNPLRVETVFLDKRRRRRRCRSRSLWNSAFELQFTCLPALEEDMKEREFAIDASPDEVQQQGFRLSSHSITRYDEWGGQHCMLAWWPIDILV